MIIGGDEVQGSYCMAAARGLDGRPQQGQDPLERSQSSAGELAELLHAPSHSGGTTTQVVRSDKEAVLPLP